MARYAPSTLVHPSKRWNASRGRPSNVSEASEYSSTKCFGYSIARPGSGSTTRANGAGRAPASAAAPGAPRARGPAARPKTPPQATSPPETAEPTPKSSATGSRPKRCTRRESTRLKTRLCAAFTYMKRTFHGKRLTAPSGPRPSAMPHRISLSMKCRCGSLQMARIVAVGARPPGRPAAPAATGNSSMASPRMSSRARCQSLASSAEPTSCDGVCWEPNRCSPK
mmetsp:Transcript_56862/g.176956  ORF Transcript_56862/g.176956 Transcript_56862/m.176956 type:complete len:225 (+) Transcript_56862:385-1059(+)